MVHANMRLVCFLPVLTCFWVSRTETVFSVSPCTVVYPNPDLTPYPTWPAALGFPAVQSEGCRSVKVLELIFQNIVFQSSMRQGLGLSWVVYPGPVAQCTRSSRGPGDALRSRNLDCSSPYRTHPRQYIDKSVSFLEPGHRHNRLLISFHMVGYVGLPLTQHGILHFYNRFLESHLRPLVAYKTHSGVKFYNF